METVTLILTTNLYDKTFSKTDSGNVYKIRITNAKLKEVDKYLKGYVYGHKSKNSSANHKSDFAEWTIKLIEKHRAISKKNHEKQDKTVLFLHLFLNWWISITSKFRNSYSKLVEETISPIPTEENLLKNPRESNPDRKIKKEKCDRPKTCILNFCNANLDRKQEKSKKVKLTSSRQQQMKTNVKDSELFDSIQAKIKTPDTDKGSPKCNTRQKASKKTIESKHKKPTLCIPAKKIQSNRSRKIKFKISHMLARFKKKERYIKMGFFVRRLVSWKSPAYTRLL